MLTREHFVNWPTREHFVNYLFKWRFWSLTPVWFSWLARVQTISVHLVTIWHTSPWRNEHEYTTKARLLPPKKQCTSHLLKFQPILHSSISTSNSKQYTCNANEHPGNPVHLHDYVAFVVFQNAEMNMSETKTKEGIKDEKVIISQSWNWDYHCLANATNSYQWSTQSLLASLWASKCNDRDSCL